MEFWSNWNMNIGGYEDKGHLISKANFSVLNSPKNNLKMLIFALAYWVRNFSFAFWDTNWRRQKVLSKLLLGAKYTNREEKVRVG